MNKAKLELYQRALMTKLKDLYSAIEGKRTEGIRDFDEPEPDIYDL